MGNKSASRTSSADGKKDSSSVCDNNVCTEEPICKRELIYPSCTAQPSTINKNDTDTNSHNGNRSEHCRYMADNGHIKHKLIIWERRTSISINATDKSLGIPGGNEIQLESASPKNRHSLGIFEESDFDESHGHRKDENSVFAKHLPIPWLGTRIKRIVRDWIVKPLGVILCLYVFIVALALMGDAFTLLGVTAASTALSNSTLLQNPLTCLMIGILVTVLLQSSSASTSIIVCIVAAKVIEVKAAIPMVMGANIGTSITNTIVAGAQARHRELFRYSFACATVHDCFNWFAVIVLLPLECTTGYLFRLTSAIVERSSLPRLPSTNIIKISDIVTDHIIQLKLNYKVDESTGKFELHEGESLIDRWAVTEDVFDNETTYDVNGTLFNYTEIHNYTLHLERNNFLFATCDFSDGTVGLILLASSLAVMMLCLFVMVKILESTLRGSAANALKEFLEKDFPRCLAPFTGYVAILIGCMLTMLLQSSSIFTSILTPLAGLRVITLERLYPLTLGANIGTTFTSLLAAFACSKSTGFVEGVQISLCHLFFNLSGIMIFYPIPILRNVPVKCANFLGKTAAQYRWFAVAYLLLVFVCLPLTIFGLSLAGWQYLWTFCIVFGTFIIAILILNVIQKKCRTHLPEKCQTWDFLPKFMRSLEPYDMLIGKCMKLCRKRRNDKDESTHEIVFL